MGGTGTQPGRPGSPIAIDFIDAFGNPPDFFLSVLDDRCRASGQEPGCVTVRFNPDRRAEDCHVQDNDPPVARTKVPVGSTVTFAVTCDSDAATGTSAGESGAPAGGSGASAGGSGAPAAGSGAPAGGSGTSGEDGAGTEPSTDSAP